MRIERAECPRNGVHDKGEASRRSDVLHGGLCGAPPPTRLPVTVHDDHPIRKLTLDCGEKKARRRRTMARGSKRGPTARILTITQTIDVLDLELKVCQI